MEGAHSTALQGLSPRDHPGEGQKGTRRQVRKSRRWKRLNSAGPSSTGSQGRRGLGAGTEPLLSLSPFSGCPLTRALQGEDP